MMIFTSLIQQTAINVFNMYCNRIFTVVNAKLPSERKVLANRATQIYGVAGFLAILLSPLVVNKLKERLKMLKLG